MKHMVRALVLLLALLGSLVLMRAQQGNMADMPGMKHAPQDSQSAEENNAQAVDATTNAMEEHEHLDMGPHMHMSTLRTPQPGDEQKADAVVQAARKALEKYKDFHAALSDGYQIHHPNGPAKMKHFTNIRYALEARFRFDPEHPTSLLYTKQGDDYRLVGAMYTAPRRFTEDQLNQRIPLSVAQWHEHVNICFPPAGEKRLMMGNDAKFGLRGSITTQAACDAAGGDFKPIIFAWMVHMYPYESTPAKIWSVEQQAQTNKMHDGMEMQH